MAHQTASDLRNNREFSRVTAHLPLEITLVPSDKRRLIQSRSEEFRTPVSKLPPDVADPLLAEWLSLLHGKIDTILSYLTAKQEARELPLIKTENIGGGGISFISADQFELEDLLEIKMIVTSHRPRTLYLYGEVVQTETRPEGFFTAVCFKFLDEHLQDEIVKFVFEKERELLRKRRE
jgi:hypothetical protein